MAIPKPVLSDDDIVEVQSDSYESASLVWNTWSRDPIKAAVLQAILPKFNFTLNYWLHSVVPVALGQNRVCFLHYPSLEVEDIHYLNVFRIPWTLAISSPSCVYMVTPGSYLLAVLMFKRTRAMPIKHHGPSGASCSAMHAK
jgi:hypothetical protein